MDTLTDPKVHQMPPLPPQALLFFLFAAAAFVGLCATARKKRNQSVEFAGSSATKQLAETAVSAWDALEKDREGDSSMALPLWQRRILMGERCELPKFSGLVLYDELGRPARSSSSHDSLLKVISKRKLNHPTLYISLMFAPTACMQVKPMPAVTTLRDLLV